MNETYSPVEAVGAAVAAFYHAQEKLKRENATGSKRGGSKSADRKDRADQARKKKGRQYYQNKRKKEYNKKKGNDFQSSSRTESNSYNQNNSANSETQKRAETMDLQIKNLQDQINLIQSRREILLARDTTSTQSTSTQSTSTQSTSTQSASTKIPICEEASGLPKTFPMALTTTTSSTETVMSTGAGN